MSSYRDDSVDTAIAGDSTWAGLSSLVTEVALASSALMFALGVLHSDAAMASDQVLDSRSTLSVDSVAANDQVLDALHAFNLAKDAARAVDSERGTVFWLHADSALAGDLVWHGLRALTTDAALASDQPITTRRSTSTVTDTARATDAEIRKVADLAEDSALVSGSTLDSLRARVLIADAAAAVDSVMDSASAASEVPVSAAAATSQTWGVLHAVDVVVDVAVADGAPVGSGLIGQAWTAHAAHWAMSRFDPYAFNALAMINGVAYGVADDGVYALDGGLGDVEGRITTGKVDVSDGPLVHPLQAFLEYELDGTAEMAVTTTQSGDPHTYTYALQPERSGSLTNGRFVFGRGLRGRHFAFELRVTGAQAYINDLRINSAPTKRRI